MTHRLKDKTVCITGLGYVGLPLALAFSRHLPTIGFDVDAGKIRELSDANDNPGITFTDNPEEIRNADFIIIAVPTPVTKSKTNYTTKELCSKGGITYAKIKGKLESRYMNRRCSG